MTPPTDYYLLRLPEVLRRRGRSRSAHYLDIEAGLFPHPVLIGGRSVAWPDYEVNAVNSARVAGKTEEEIRALVTALEAARKAAC